METIDTYFLLKQSAGSEKWDLVQSGFNTLRKAYDVLYDKVSFEGFVKKELIEGTFGLLDKGICSQEFEKTDHPCKTLKEFTSRYLEGDAVVLYRHVPKAIVINKFGKYRILRLSEIQHFFHGEEKPDFCKHLLHEATKKAVGAIADLIYEIENFYYQKEDDQINELRIALNAFRNHIHHE